MKTEVEKLFWDIDKEKLKIRVLELGGKLEKPESLYKRVVWSLPLKNGRHNWLRLRDEGDKIVLTYKIKSEVEHAEEVETDLDISRTCLRD